MNVNVLALSMVMIIIIYIFLHSRWRTKISYEHNGYKTKRPKSLTMAIVQHKRAATVWLGMYFMQQF